MYAEQNRRVTLKNLKLILIGSILLIAGCKSPADPSDGTPTSKDTLVPPIVLTSSIIAVKTIWTASSGFTTDVEQHSLADSTTKHIIRFTGSSISSFSLSSDSSTLVYDRASFDSLYVAIGTLNLRPAPTVETVISDSRTSPLRLFPTWTHDNGLAYMNLEGIQWKIIRNGVVIPLDTAAASNMIAFSKDGAFLVYSHWRDSVRQELYRYDLSSKKTTLIVPADMMTGSCSYSDYDISPDGAELVFVKRWNTTDSAGTIIAEGTDIRTVNTDGTGGAMLLRSAVKNVRWTPDGRYIAYLVSATMYAMKKDGSNISQVSSKFIPQFIFVR